MTDEERRFVDLVKGGFVMLSPVTRSDVSRWSTISGVLAGAAVLACWWLWYLATGDTPIDTPNVEVTFGDNDFVQLSAYFESWWLNTLAAIPLAAWIAAAVRMVRRSPIEGPFSDGILFGLVLGLPGGLLFGLVGGIASILVGGIVPGLVVWCFFYFGGGLGYAAGFAPVFGACIGLVYSLPVGLATAAGTAIAIATPILVVSGGYYTCHTIYERLFRHTEPLKAEADPA